MALDISSLIPLVRQILTAPDVDLETISASQIRKQLPDLDKSLSQRLLKEHKQEVKELIAAEFARLNGGGGSDTEGPEEEDEQEEEEEEEKPKPKKKARKREDDSDEDAAPARKPKKSKTTAKSEGPSDAELARQLSAELNSRARRSTTKVARKATSTQRRGVKSAETIGSDLDSEAESSPKSKKAKAKPKAKRASTATGEGVKKGGFHKLYKLSEPLAVLLNETKLSRPATVKALWVYIKAEKLQNPGNGREIVADPKFRAVFNVDKIDMMKMNKELGKHLYDLEEEA